MKKFLLSVVCLMVVGIQSVVAQKELVATLSHNGETTQFYGSTALQAAHDAAENGDIITLSSGLFQRANFSKSVSVRGIGMLKDTVSNIGATIVNSIVFSDKLSNVSFEGINISNIEDNSKTISEIVFEKCKIDRLLGNTDFVLLDWKFINCIIIFTHISGQKNMYYKNCCIIENAVSSDDAVQYFENCIVRMTRGGSGGIFLPVSMHYNTFKNCILCNNYANEGGLNLPGTVTALNNLGVGYVYFSEVPNASSNVHVDDFEQVFKTYDGGAYKDDETYELTDEAAATYLGDDGTQVGIYGGDNPFNTTLSYPQFTKANVAKKAVDGKLSVNIELNGGN